MAITIDELQVQIEADASNAAGGIDALSASLARLKTSVKGGAGLTTTTKQLHALSAAVAQLKMPGDKINQLVSALAPLQTIRKSNLGTAINQLKKIPEITNALANTDMGAFAAKIREVTAAILPLSTEMAKISAGFSKLPANIQKAITANAKLTASNHGAAKSYGILGTGISSAVAKFSLAFIAVSRVARVISGWITESNAYVENLNLFTVAMGEYAKAAQAYAESVGEIMGIDPSMWMRQQGIFMTLATGFGVASEKASVMSKNLVQLGYDLSSFFNISVEDAMQKLQSGFSGELEPLRRLGYDLSQAKLETIAFSLGIRKNIADMNQAEKSQLRYYAMLTQVTTAQGDMARTLSAPANQLRIFQAQLIQAGRALGNIFIPALNAVLPYAIAFLKVIRTVANEVANLFGFELPEIDYSGLQGISTAGEDATGVLDETTDAVNDLKTAMLGIDELNIINPNTASGVGGISTGGDLGFEVPEYDFLAGLTESRANEIFENVKRWFDELKVRLDKLKPAIDKLNQAWKGFQKALSDFMNDPIVKAVMDFFGDLTIEIVSSGIAGALMMVSGVLRFLTGIIKSTLGWWQIFSGVINKDEKLIAAGFKTVHEGAVDMGAGLLLIGEGIIEGNPISVLAGIAENDKSVEEWYENGVEPTFDKSNWSGLWEEAKFGWAIGWDRIKSWWDNEGVGKWWTDNVAPWFTKEKWQSLWFGVQLGWSLGWKVVETWWNNAAISKLWNESIKPWFTFDKWKGLWDDAFAGWRAAWEEIVKWWNSTALSDILGKLGVEIEPVSGGGSAGGGAQAFATGGYPTAGQLFIANESGPEMVGSIGGRTAVASNEDIVGAVSKGVYEAVLSAMSGRDNSSGGSFNVYLEGKQLHAAIKKTERERGVGIMTGGLLNGG